MHKLYSNLLSYLNFYYKNTESIVILNKKNDNDLDTFRTFLLENAHKNLKLNLPTFDKKSVLTKNISNDLYCCIDALYNKYGIDCLGNALDVSLKDYTTICLKLQNNMYLGLTLIFNPDNFVHHECLKRNIINMFYEDQPLKYQILITNIINV